MPVRLSTTKKGSAITNFNETGSHESQCAQTQWEVAPWLTIDLKREVAIDRIVLAYHGDTSGELLIYEHRPGYLLIKLLGVLPICP